MSSVIKLSTLPKDLQIQIRQEMSCLSSIYSKKSLPILASKDVKSLVRDYLLTTNLNLTVEEEQGITKGEYSGIFVKSSPSRRYEVLLFKNRHLGRIKKALISYLQAEKDKASFADQEEYNSHLTTLSTSIPLQGRILCTRQGVNFLAKNYRPLNTNLGKRY